MRCDVCGGPTVEVLMGDLPVVLCDGECSDPGCCVLGECDSSGRSGLVAHRGAKTRIVKGSRGVWREVSGFDPVSGVDLWGRGL